MSKEKTLHLVSLGCTKNLVDSEVMLGRLKNYKLTNEPQNADVIIVNTCGFIDAAKTESINTILSLHQARKEGSLLVMAGCLSERYREELVREMPEVDIFTGVGDYAKIDELLRQKESHFSDEVFLIGGEERVVSGSRLHVYIKLSEGCNQACSFCAIPSFKGKLQSRPLEQITDEVKRLVARGFRDFSFISQDSSSYGRDFGKKDGLISLIDEIENIDGVVSARILYLYPSTTSLEFISRIGRSRVFQNYFDMPIQHISKNMLKTMKRGVGKQEHIELLEAMRALPKSFVRTSVIIGHPGEREVDFAELCKFLEEFRFDRVNVFEYSDEEGTDSYEMSEKIDSKVIKKRIKEVQKVVAKTTKSSLKKMIDTEVIAIIESKSEESDYLYSARPLLFAPEIDGEVLINDSLIDGELNGIYNIKITEIKGNQILGSVLAKYQM